MDKHVLFLGAGASVDAGYPLTNDLLTLTKKYTKQYNRVIFSEAIEKVIKEKNKHTIFEQEFLIENDAELFFTFPDILRRIREIKEHDIYFNKLATLSPEMSEAQYEQAVNDIYQESKVDNINKIEANFKLIKLAVEEMLYCLFENSCHQQQVFSYIKNMTANVNVIITTNWDAVTERSLFKQNLWNPSDGYGFKVDVRDFWGDHKRGRSKIKILKLHGGIGWRVSSDKLTIAREFLHWLTDEELSDKNAYLANDEVYMQFPSFAKELIHPEAIQIWDKADSLLHKCNKLTVVGYSLPDSDTNIRALFLPIRRKIKRGNFDLKIIIGQKGKIDGVKDKWIKFLQCSEEDIVCENAEDYFNKSCY